MAALPGLARRLTAALIVLGALSMTTPSRGDYAFLSPEQLAAQSDLIVVGRLVGRDAVRIGESTQIVGVVHIERVVAGPAGRTVALLLLPAQRPGGLVSSTDFAIENGQRGLWYLQRTPEGFYRINRPDRFVTPGSARWPAGVPEPD